VTSIKEKYAGGQLRRALRYRAAGIPEQFWFKTYHDSFKVKTAIDDYKSGTFCVGIGENSLDISHFLADIIKGLGGDNKKFMSFSDLVLKLSKKFDRDGLFKDMVLNELEVLAVSNIRPSRMYDDYVDVFLTFLDRFVNSVHEVKLVLGIQYIKSEEFIGAYGNEFFNFINQRKFTMIKL